MNTSSRLRPPVRLRFALAAMLLVTLSACSKAPAPEAPIRSVKLQQVVASAASERREYAGDVRARVETRLGFRVGGKIAERRARLGQRVRAGELLAQLDPNDLALAGQAAQAQTAAAAAQRDLAQADLKRSLELKAQGFVSGAEVERRQATLQAAEASLRQAQAQGRVQQNQAGYARLLASAAGVVVGVDAEVGQVVAAGATVVRLALDGARDVVIAVPEDAVQRLQPGQAAQVGFWTSSPVSAENARTRLPAEVREVAASADPVTRTFQVRLALPEGADVALGQTATVIFAPAADSAPAAIRLPTSAVVAMPGTDRSASAVWVFDAANQTVQQRRVVVSGSEGDQLLVTDGLRPGEEVVVAGTHVLSPGQKVTRFAGPAAQ